MKVFASFIIKNLITIILFELFIKILPIYQTAVMVDFFVPKTSMVFHSTICDLKL
jgi:hypothetical protein